MDSDGPRLEMVRWAPLAMAGFFVLACAVARGPEGPMPGPDFAAAARSFQNNCAPCHGSAGGGDGPMADWLEIAPRDLRREKIHYVSSTSATAANPEDVERTIRRGITTRAEMPSSPFLSDRQVKELAEYVLELRRLGMVEDLTRGLTEDGEEFTAEEVERIVAAQMKPPGVTPVPARSADYVSDFTKGKALFDANCASCHGATGRGDGDLALVDDLGRRIRPRDLGLGEFLGGARDEDLFWRIRCGIPGTPMPATTLGDEDTWALIDYVRSLARGS